MSSTRNKPSQQRVNARQRARQRAEQQRRRQRLLLIVGSSLGVLVIVGGLLAAIHIYGTVQNQRRTAAALTVDDVQCQNSEALAYHIHAHLTLFQDGKPVTLPANIGIPVGSNLPSGQCFYWIHVHDTTGVVHIESPTTKTYTLGQMLDIWDRTSQLDTQGAGGYQVDNSFVTALRAANPSDVHVYVGDKQVTDFNSIPLTAHELITIEIGGPLQPPTTAFTFPNGE
jgi:hypothetical protein